MISTDILGKFMTHYKLNIQVQITDLNVMKVAHTHACTCTPKMLPHPSLPPENIS